MPFPVPYWTAKTPLTPKSLNIPYADDGSVTGTQGVGGGIWFHTSRPVSLQTQTSATSVYIKSSSAGLRTNMSLLVSTLNGYQKWADSAALFGAASDNAGQFAQYLYSPCVKGSSGSATTAGGWVVIGHFVPIAHVATQQTAGADLMQGSATFINAGSRQRASTGRNNCPFYLDLRNTNGVTQYAPAAWLSDSAGTSTTSPNSTDASGETPRFFTFWAGADTWSAPANNPSLPAPPTSIIGDTTFGTTGSTNVNVNSQVADTLNYLSYPPLFRNSIASTQSIPNATTTAVTLSSLAASGVDNFSGYDGTSTYTVARDGLYLIHGLAAWAIASAGTFITGVSINGTVYWGPGYTNSAAGVSVYSTKTQVFSLKAGDTVQLVCRQTTGGAWPLTNATETRLFMVWLGKAGVPAALWTVPDTSFRWQSGTSGTDFPALAQTHIANDLGFLVDRPYLLTYQTSAQTGFANNTWNTITMDTVGGIVHADNGDNYSGWTSGASNKYTAQRSGWHLAVAEYTATVPTTTSTCALAAGFNVPSSGGAAANATPDWYQHIFPSLNSAEPPGATGVGMYYLQAGETIQPQLMAQDYTATTWGTIAGTASGGTVDSHFELVWLSGP